MASVGSEPMIPAFERAKTVHALERAATVTDMRVIVAVILVTIVALVGGTR
jgi:hypothetical protein